MANLGVDHGAPGTSAVSKCSATTGEVINPRFITGLTSVSGIAVSGNLLLNNRLYVADSKGGTVGKYDAKTGAAINDKFITGLSDLYGVAAKPAK